MRRRGVMRHIGVVTQASALAGGLTQGRRWASRVAMSPGLRGARGAAGLVGTGGLLGYVLPGLSAPAAHWPLWEVAGYWGGGRPAPAGGGGRVPRGARA